MSVVNLEKRVYQTEITVRGYHIDVYGHVNNARYLEFLEEARWAVLDENAEALIWFKQHNYAFTIQRIEIDYKRSALKGDTLVVETALAEYQAKSFILAQSIKRQRDNKTIAEARVSVCLISTEVRGAVPLDQEKQHHIELLWT